MDINNLKGLMEAYQQVNAPQEVDEATAMAKRGYDEAPIRQKIAKSTGGGKAADRASALEKKSTFGDAKKAKQRTDYARKQRGDFRKTTSSSPGLHGYAHKSDDAGVKAKQAARGAQRGALTPAEKKQFNREEFDVFETVLEFLCVEGYAETLEEAEWMMANIIDEEAIAIIVEAMHGEKEDDEEMKNGKKSKKSEEDEGEEEEELDEALTGARAKRAIEKGAGMSYLRYHGSGKDETKLPTKIGGRGEKGKMKQSTLNVGDAGRGAGNKAARRAGKSVEDSRYEEVEYVDEALTGERIKKVINKPGGTNYTRMHSKDPKKRPTKRGGWGEKGTSKQSDFSAADRGAGNKAARRAGRDVYDSRYEAFEAWLDEAMTNYEKNRKRAAQRAAARNAARDQGKTGAVPGVGYVTPRRESEYWTDESGKKRHAKGL